jgi:hypothetical protein
MTEDRRPMTVTISDYQFCRQAAVNDLPGSNTPRSLWIYCGYVEKAWKKLLTNGVFVG